MPRFFFHLSKSDEIISDNIGSEIFDLAAAHSRALQLADRVMSISGLVDNHPDWRRWTVHVADQNQRPMFVVIFPACFTAQNPRVIAEAKGARALQQFLDEALTTSTELLWRDGA